MQLLGAVVNGTKHYCCTPAALAAGACGKDQKTGLILQPAAATANPPVYIRHLKVMRLAVHLIVINAVLFSMHYDISVCGSCNKLIEALNDQAQ